MSRLLEENAAEKRTMNENSFAAQEQDSNVHLTHVIGPDAMAVEMDRYRNR